MAPLSSLRALAVKYRALYSSFLLRVRRLGLLLTRGRYDSKRFCARVILLRKHLPVLDCDTLLKMCP